MVPPQVLAQRRSLFLSIYMKRIFLYLGFVALSLAASSCVTQQAFGYEMVCLGVGTEGSNLLKVYSYAKNYDKAVAQAKHDAVHGILFKGIVGSNGCGHQPAIVKPEEMSANQAFFDNFFQNGEYLRFVNISNDGSVSGADRLKVGNMYKIGVCVSVQKDALRKYLESAGIIKTLGVGIF